MIDVFGRPAQAPEIPDFDLTAPISYSGAQQRVARHRGRPSAFNCAFCFGDAECWAYRGRSKHEQTGTVTMKQNKGGLQTLRWSPNPMDYIPLCNPCVVKRRQAVHGVAAE